MQGCQRGGLGRVALLSGRGEDPGICNPPETIMQVKTGHLSSEFEVMSLVMIVIEQVCWTIHIIHDNKLLIIIVNFWLVPPAILLSQVIISIFKTKIRVVHIRIIAIV